MNTVRYAPLLILLALAACTAADARLAVPDDRLAGTVAEVSGTPLAGAAVTARAADRPVAVTVFSDEEGRFVLPELASGAYTLEIRHPGFAPAEQPVEGGTPALLDVRLERATTAPAVPSAAYLALLPDGEAKRHFVLDCTGCHQFDAVMIAENGQRRSRASWQQRTAQMIAFAGGHSGFPIMAPSRDAAATAAWLTEHLGEGGPLPTLDPPAPPTGEAARAVITEYDVPNAQDLPHDVALMADGRVLITGMMTHQMFVLDPAAGTFTAHEIPIGYANPRAVDIDEAGRWWVLLGYPQKIARYDPAAEEWTTFDVGMYPHSIARDAEGRVWFNGHFTKNPEQIGYVEPATGAVTLFDVPTPAMPDGGSTIPYGLRFGPDGMLWGTQLAGGRLVRFDPATEAFTLYDLPTPVSGPRRPDVGPDGTVWIPEYAAGKLARFDPAEETFTEYELPVANALPYIVRVDAERGYVWIATAAADAVFRFDLDDETFVTYPLPTPRALVRHMALDAATGAVWLAYGNSPAVAPKIARLVVRD